MNGRADAKFQTFSEAIQTESVAPRFKSNLHAQNYLGAFEIKAGQLNTCSWT
jgi:hypothetical protein